MKGNELVVPVIHLNGTSREMLTDELEAAYYALGKAYDAVKKSGPNGRDYYPVPGLMEKAVAQHNARLAAIDEVRDSISRQLAAIN